MKNIISNIRRSVISSLRRKKRFSGQCGDDKITLGVLLRGIGAVATADGVMDPDEKRRIGEILSYCADIRKEDFSVVFTAIRQSALSEKDFFRFVREANKRLTHRKKIRIIGILFKVACADKKLHDKEMDVITKIAGLLHVSRRELLDIKKENLEGEEGICR